MKRGAMAAGQELRRRRERGSGGPAAGPRSPAQEAHTRCGGSGRLKRWAGRARRGTGACGLLLTLIYNAGVAGEMDS